MSTDHLAQAREYIAIAESEDSKREAYEKAADALVAWVEEDPTRSYREADRSLGRGNDYCRKLVRWRTSAEAQRHPFSRSEGESERRARVAAESVLGDSEQRKQVIATLPSEQIEEVIQEAHGVVMDRLHSKQAEHDTAPKAPTAGDLMGDSPFDPSESWVDADIIRVREKAHSLRRQVEKWGLVLGSMDDEQAFAYLQEAERNIAEVRAALQERMADRSRAEV